MRCEPPPKPLEFQVYTENYIVIVTKEDARAIIQRIRQTTKDQTGVRVLSHPHDFTQQTAHVFALNFAKVLSCLNVSTERGENREWEVGNHSHYDDLNTKQSGTHLSM